MKILAMIFLLLPLAAASQSQQDYEKTMAKFQQFYNKGQGDSINAMFGHLPGEMKSTMPIWTNKSNTELLNEYGTLISFKFIGTDESDPQKVYVFQTEFSKAGTKATSLTLYSDRSLGTFRYMTSSESISQLLKKSKTGR